MEPAEYDRMDKLEHQLWWFRALHAATLDRIQNVALPASARLLDASCGSGGLIAYLNNHPAGLPPDLQLYGLEHHFASAKRSKEKSHAKIVNGNLNNLPFQQDSFDVITCNDVLYHQNVNPESSLSELLRVLKPGGSLLLHLPAFTWLESAHDKHVHTRERYTRKTCRGMLKAQGFIVKRCAYWNSLLFPLMMGQRLTCGKNKTSSDVETVNSLLDLFLFNIISLERTLAQAKIFLPFGGSVWAWAIKPRR